MDLLQTIARFAEAVNEADDLSALGDCVVKTFSHQLGLPDGAMWVRESDPEHYRLVAKAIRQSSGAMPITVASDHPLILGLHHNPGLRLRTSVPQTPIGLALSMLDAAVCIPFRIKAGLLGFCTLGPRRSTTVAQEASALAEAMASIVSQALAHHLAQHHSYRSTTLMRRTDRLHSLEILAGGLAHEIRNPLTSIKTFVQLTPQRHQDPVFITEFSKLAIEDIHRIESLLHEILDYAGSVPPQPGAVDLNDLVSSCIGFVSASAARRNIPLCTSLASCLPVLSLDRQQIKQAILNLLLNALDAMQDRQGHITVRTALTLQAGRPWVQVQVEDQGCGIAPEHLEYIFDPFFTTKHTNSASDGSGLGLTTAHQIVREHCGDILVESRVGVGSTFTVTLPASADYNTVVAALE